MKKTSICSGLFLILCLFQLPSIFAQENPIAVEFKLVCDGNSDECEKVIAAATGEELYVQKAALLSLEDVDSAEVDSSETPSEIADALNQVGLKADSKSTSLILKLNNTGKEKLSEATSQNIGERIAIFIDGDLVLVPQIYEPISGGELAVSYSSLDKAKSIVERINQTKEFNKKN